MANWKVLISLLVCLVCLSDAKRTKKRTTNPPKSNTVSVSKSRNLNEDSGVVCSALKVNEAKLSVNLDEPMRYEEMLQLMTYVNRFELGKGKVQFKLKDAWKRRVLDQITSIFSIGCPHQFVPTSFVNIVTELFAIYLNSVSGKNAAGGKAEFTDLLGYLDTCRNATEALQLRSNGYEISGLKFRIGRQKEGAASVSPPEETMDKVIGFPDRIIDSMWWIFSFSFGQCYPYFTGNRALRLSQLKKAFYNSFLKDLTKRWKFGGSWTMAYGPIFGNINLQRTFRNVRTCAAAAYVNSETGDRQLVRPVNFSPTEVTADLSLHNKKTGGVWSPLK